jgi:hypothetical protein
MGTIDVTSSQRRVCRLRRRAAIVFALSVAVLGALTAADSAWASGSTLPPAPAAAPPSGQAAIDAATEQAATAVADASQNHVQNVVVIIRINSPGDDVINQSNTSIANGVATNTSSTGQGTGTAPATDEPSQGGDASTRAPAPSSSPSPGNGSSTTPSAASGPTPDAAAAAAEKRATPGPERARPRSFAAAQRPSAARPAASRNAAVVAHPTESAPNRETVAEPARRVASEPAASAGPRSTSAPRAARQRSTARVLSTSGGAHRTAAAASSGAAQLFGGPTRSYDGLAGAAAHKAGGLSTAVVATLLAVLAILLGVGFTRVAPLRSRPAR